MMPHKGLSLLRRSLASDLIFCLDRCALFFDACFLTCEFAQVVQLGATHLTAFVHLNAFNVGRFDGEDTLYADSARHLADGETALVTMTVDFDYNATVELDTLLGTLNDAIGNGDGVARTELRKLFACLESLFGYFH